MTVRPSSILVCSQCGKQVTAPRLLAGAGVVRVFCARCKADSIWDRKPAPIVFLPVTIDWCEDDDPEPPRAA